MTMGDFYRQARNITGDILCPKCGKPMKEYSSPAGDLVCFFCESVFEITDKAELVDHSEELWETIYSDGGNHEFDDPEEYPIKL